MQSKELLLDVQGLRTSFYTSEGCVTPVDRVSFQVGIGETVAMVGESGCGKTQTALSVMRLIPSPPGAIEAGTVYFEGQDLLKLSKKEMENVRGNKIGMIFQEPMTSLNPVFTIGMQLCEPLLKHRNLAKSDAEAQAVRLLHLVGIPEPEKRLAAYPHHLSGGMRQRVMIAMALACNPSLLIADEPTTALDVTIQAQILDLLRRLRHELKMAILLITHDLGVVAEMASRVLVMYAGRIVEEADVYQLFSTPSHPYTMGLLASIPRLDERPERLHQIAGTVPNLLELPKGCRFAPRCAYAQEKCFIQEPELTPTSEPGRRVACWYPLLPELKEVQA